MEEVYKCTRFKKVHSQDNREYNIEIERLCREDTDSSQNKSGTNQNRRTIRQRLKEQKSFHFNTILVSITI